MARKSQRFRRQRKIERLRTREKAAKLTQAIEDNSAILERMKIMSGTIAEVVQKIEVPTETKTESTTSPVVEMKAEPVVEMKEEPSVEMRIQPFVETKEETKKTPANLKKMTKRKLTILAKEQGITIRPTMTKAQIIRTINQS